MEAPSIHLRVSLTDHGDIDLSELVATVSSPVWCHRIVELRVSGFAREYITSEIGDAVTQIMQACVFLKTFYFSVVPEYPDSVGETSLELDKDYTGQLTELRLDNLPCRELDLGSATDLTSIPLADIDTLSRPCKLSLPDCVKSLNFLGSTLFYSSAKHCLEELTSLSRLTLGTNDSYGQQQLDTCSCMPTLPSSLRFLHVTCCYLERLLDFSAFRCLQACTNSEHLILPEYF